MKKKRAHLIQDILIVLLSIYFAVYLVTSGFASNFVMMFESVPWIGIIFAGMFFTSIFTTAPAIALLSQFAESTSLPLLAIIGGVGAVMGDYIIFKFVKDRISEDIKYIVSRSARRKYSAILHARLFRYLVPFLGALVIASPFPDEIGVALLGVAGLKNKYFLSLSFLANAAGILIVGWLATRVI